MKTQRAETENALAAVDAAVTLTLMPKNTYPKEETGADKIVEHISAAVGEVHDHTLKMIADLTQRLEYLKQQVENEKKATILKFENYVALSNDTLKLTDKIKDLVGEIEDSLIKGHA